MRQYAWRAGIRGVADIKGKTIVVTGSESFIGAEVIKQARTAGATVIGIDARATTDNTTHEADIRSSAIGDLIPEKCDALIHLAALSRDSDCRDNARRCFDVNVLGTLNLLDAGRARNMGQFIFTSTEWVYDWFEDDKPRREDDPVDLMALSSEYALSKLVSEANIRQAYQQNGMASTILRLGIIYGPRKNNWAAVEALTNTVATKEQVEVGSLKTARAFIHVADIASGILASVGLTGVETLNLQGKSLITLGEIIAVAGRLLSRSPKVVEKSPENVSVRNVSGEKAWSKLDWEPVIPIEDGIRSILPTLGLSEAV